MLDNLVDVQERNKRKRKTTDRRRTLNQWLMECEDDTEVQLFEPLKSKRVKFAAQDNDYREYVSRSTKRDHQRNPLRAQKWAVDE